MSPLFLYIDPGTGSMLFSLFIGLATAAVFAGRALILKLKFLLSGGKVKEDKNCSKFVIYSDHKRYWNVFKPVCDEFEKRRVDLLYLTQSENDPVFEAVQSEKNPAGYKHIKAEFIGESNKGFAQLNMLKADIVLSTTPGLDVLQWKRSRDVKWYVHIPHTVDELSGYRMFALDFYDAVLATGKNQKETIRKLEKLREEKPKEIVITGCTHFDAMKNQIENSSKPHTQTVKVLVAPSWGKSSLLNLYGTKLLDSLVSTGFEIVIRPHPQSYTAEPELLEKLKNAYKGNPKIIWNQDNDNFDCLNTADIMITDFSGIIFDYSMLFNKPLIFTKPETFNDAPYEQAWIKNERWTFLVLPKLGIELDERNFPNIKSVIEKAIKSNILQQGRDEVREECWTEIGKASKNAADYLIAKQKELTEKKK